MTVCFNFALTWLDWFYGWKCDAVEQRGIFPTACTRIPSESDLADIYAEIMSFFPVTRQVFMVGVFFQFTPQGWGQKYVLQSCYIFTRNGKV